MFVFCPIGIVYLSQCAAHEFFDFNDFFSSRLSKRSKFFCIFFYKQQLSSISDLLCFQIGCCRDFCYFHLADNAFITCNFRKAFFWEQLFFVLSWFTCRIFTQLKRHNTMWYLLVHCYLVLFKSETELFVANKMIEGCRFSSTNLVLNNAWYYCFLTNRFFLVGRIVIFWLFGTISAKVCLFTDLPLFVVLPLILKKISLGFQWWVNSFGL